MLGQLAGEDEADGGLDLPGGDGWLLVHARQLQVMKEEKGRQSRISNGL